MRTALLFPVAASFLLCASAGAQGTIPGLGPALYPRIHQDDLDTMTLFDIRLAGRRVFSTPFNKFDGYGDGPHVDGEDPTLPGGRPTIGGNGTWLRVNGLDSQTCLECHSVLANRDIPATFAPGGVGGIAASALPGITSFDIADADGNGIAEVNGRKINPPFVWGSGGVELVAKEMTLDLQALIARAKANPNTIVSLDTKGVNFGSIVYVVDSSGGSAPHLDTSKVVGIDPDLVVRPFGRKGDNATLRKFDTGAMMFHHGMQPAEVVGEGVDGDQDGVVDEILDGELSVLHIFQAASTKPEERSVSDTTQIANGKLLFTQIGCAECHVPSIDTDSTLLTISYPEVEADPNANVFYKLDLEGGSANFQHSTLTNGIVVPMYSDLKRHDIGTFDTTENPVEYASGNNLDHLFITPRLWGLADTAPYLNDGRALTVTEAIKTHDVEAAAAKDAFFALDLSSQYDVLVFLDSLRAPTAPNSDLDSGTILGS